MEVLLKILFAYIWGVLHFGSFISYNLCEIFLSWLFSFICVCVCVQLCSHVHFWQNITTRTIWSCCICWIGWANHFHRGFDKSFRIQAGAEPVRVRRLHRWKTKMQLRSEEDASSHSQDYLIWYNKDYLVQFLLHGKKTVSHVKISHYGTRTTVESELPILWQLADGPRWAQRSFLCTVCSSTWRNVCCWKV